jgi:hypothetical protein
VETRGFDQSAAGPLHLRLASRGGVDQTQLPANTCLRARGAENLWASSSPTPDGTPLEAAVGTGRASVLKALLPATTTELAHRLRLSPAAVSAHPEL